MSESRDALPQGYPKADSSPQRDTLRISALNEKVLRLLFQLLSLYLSPHPTLVNVKPNLLSELKLIYYGTELWSGTCLRQSCDTWETIF